MATDLKGYTSSEVLNKVLNTSNDSLKVDIVSGAEYAEDSAHTDADTGNFILGVRNDTLAALGGTDGDYVPFQMNSSGALFVEVASSSGDASIYVDDADWTNSSSKHTLVGGLYQSSPQTITDGDVGPLQVNSSGNLIVDLSATDNAVLDTIAASLSVLDDWDDSNYANVNINLAGSDAPTGGGAESGALRVTIANDSTGVLSVDDGGGALTVDGTVTANLSTTDNAVLDAMAASLALLDNSIASGNELQVDVVASLPSGSNTIGVVDLGSTDNAVLDAIAIDGDNIQTLLSTLDGVQDSALTKLGEIETTNNANQVLLGTIDSDTDATKSALNKMLYGTGLAVTALHGGSDHTLGATYEAFFIGVGGDISLDMGTSGTNIVFKNLASGQMLPVQATVVNATNTTATNIVALKA